MYRHVIAYTVTDSSAICVAYGSSECIAYSGPYTGAYTSTYTSTYAGTYASTYTSTYGIAHERYECVTDFIAVSCTIGIANVRSVSCSYS